MREKLRTKLKQNRAFTLVEMLVVVAVMVVLLAISIIGLNEIVVSMKMTELDNYAKSIYLEAQNQLIAEKVEGGMPLLAELFEEEREANRLTVTPQDYTYDTVDMDWKNLYQISKSDVYSDYLISTKSYIYDAEGDYIIEFNPQTGMVYGVFYWDKDVAIDYNEDIVKLVDRTREERKDIRIGYYGGITSEVLEGSLMLNQQVELVNSEELYLRISYEASARLLAYHDSALNVEYIISDEHGNAWKGTIHPGNIYNQTDNVDVVNAGRRLDIYVLLDSMEVGYGLADIAVETDSVTGKNQCNLVLDDELTISVTSVYDHGSDYCVESNVDAPLKCNGLYANGSEKTQTEGVVQAHLVQIEKVRHLRNLDYLNTAPVINIQITDHVDFNSDDYEWAFVKNDAGAITNVSFDDTDYDEINGVRPIDVFAPISNADIFEAGTCSVSIDGTDCFIQNFYVAGNSDNIGLFATLNGVNISNITIQDMVVNGENYNNVGTLAGQMSGGTLENCGAYLTTSNVSTDGVRTYYSQMSAVEGNYVNEMDRRVKNYRVTGNSNVGGLVGVLNSLDVSGSYAAVAVNASGNNVGGFAGMVADTSIMSSYSSGDVSGNRNVGGFAGNMNHANVGGSITENGVTTVAGVYSTSDVYANANMGGFVGISADTTYDSVTSYGSVMLSNGASNVDHVNGGGFVGVSEEGNTFDANCSYLAQTDYNSKVANKELVASKGYNDYLAGTANDLAAGTSFPYDTNLFNTAFPFAVHWAEQPHHYGDWPTQYVINTSLVYYEKYDDGNGKYTYGFYCITYIAGSEKQWLLNSLQERECIEDGYAILTKYNLESIEYDLQIGSVIKADDPSSDLLKTGKLEDAYINYNLDQKKEVVFRACDTEGNIITGDEADTFKVAGMYLYQLPYELQCTERYHVENFYDRLVLKNGIIYDADPYASDIVVIEELTFFYCPHFAKTAVNPNLTSNSDLSKVTLPNPENVAVRSARQLNSLGRYQYYWNTKGGNETKITFIQETDVNFGTYAGVEKEYCGEIFNLLAFDQPYSNRPIGDPDNPDVETTGGFNYAQFQNNYDGKGNKIIDYCVKSSNQYVGLFGETYLAKISNIVMVVSDKNAGNTGNYNVEGITAKEQNNAGLIIGIFQDDLKNEDGSSRENNDRKRTGVGALIGLDYTVGTTGSDFSPEIYDDGEREYTIENCAVAGYKVEYHINPLESGKQQPLGIAIGGLAGFSFGNITNSTAVNDVKLVVNTDYAENDGNECAVFIGGFAGAFYHGTIHMSYSGGTISVDDGNDNGAGYKVHRMRIAGFCPGWMEIPSYPNPNNTSSEQVRYEHVYSYTEVSDEVWNTVEADGSTKFMYLMPCVSRLKIEYVEVGALWWKEWKWNTEDISGSTEGVRVPGMSYYLDTFFFDHQDELNAAKKYDEVEAYYSDSPQTCRETTYAYLSDIDALNKTEKVSEEINRRTYTEYFAGNEAYYSYPVASYLKSMAYPFPAVITDANGNYVHYGDWPVKEEVVTTQFPAYYEKYSDGTYGYFMMREDGSTENYLVAANDTLQIEALPGDEKTIVENGYGWFTMDENAKDSCKFQTTIKNGEDGGMYYYYFLKVEDWAGTGVDVNANDRCEFLDFSFTAVKVVSGEVSGSAVDNVKRIYLNPNYACAISLNETDLGTKDNPLQVRTQAQLSSVNNMNEPNVYIQMTHSIAVDDSYTAINVKTSQVFDGGSIFAIGFAKTSVFQSNTGTIQNVTVVNSVISTDQNTAIFVNTNAGQILNSKVLNANINSTGNVAGFVYKNTGNVENSGVYATESYGGAVISGVNAYGFVVENTGTMTHCYAVGTVNASSEAAGFAGVNTGTISLSYANMLVSTNAAKSTVAGFAMEAGTVQNCYATGSVTGVDAYGFMKNGNAESCYTISAIDGANKHGFAGEDAVTNNCYWGYDVEAEYNISLIPDVNNPPAGAIALHDFMRDIADYQVTDADAVPYSAVLGDRYPYPAVGIAHYGDWTPPTAEINDSNTDDEWRIDLMNGEYKYAGIFYYERYMDGSYGFYLKGINQRNTVIDLEIYSLADEEEYVVTSGYGVFYQDTRWDIFFDEDIRNDVTDFEANILDGFYIEGVEEAYQYRYLNKDGLQSAFTRTLYYNPLITNTITIWESEITNAKK